MLVLFAMAFTVLIGIMGLAVDYGFLTYERRTLQKAADAAAMSGALNLVDSSTWGSISTDVSTMVTRNNVPAGTATACALVDNSNAQIQANCNTPTNTTTSGVRVTLSRTRDNFFLGVLGIPTANVAATAIGRVVLHDQYDAGNSPFIVCGINTELADSNGTFSILTGSPPTVNPAAVGKNFEIHGPQVAHCGAGNSSFKGLADMDKNEGITTLPATIYHDTGVKAGPTRRNVDGPNGCPAGVDHNCVMIIPVANDITGSPKKEASAVLYLPFLVTQAGANEHNGRLISTNYYLRLPSPSSASWTIGKKGLVAARLVN